MIQDTLGIALVLVAVIALSLWLCDRFKWAAKLSSVVWILMLGAVASNSGLIPFEADLYGGLVGFTVPFAVALIVIPVHMVFVYGVGRMLRMDVGVLTVASVAAKAGPPLVLATRELRARITRTGSLRRGGTPHARGSSPRPHRPR